MSSRIAVVTSSPPLVEGGHMAIARALVRALREAGHQAGIVVTPQNRFGRQASAYLATWLTDVGSADGRPVDRVISLRYPSYAVRHPRHVCWLNHTMREYYDLWDRFSAGLGTRGRVKEQVRRRLIHAVDRYLLTRNVRRVFVQSRTIQERLRIWPELKTTVLYPPPPQRAYRSEAYGDYFLFVSRLTPLKRADLLVRALAQPDGRNLRVVIGGEGEEMDRLRGLAASLGVADRVSLEGRLSEERLLAHLAQCRAVCFPPLDEDYGFVTAEAFASARAVVTCRDSGGPAELVTDEVDGFVCDPAPAALALALRRLAEDRALAERMGQAARSRAKAWSWPAAVDQLTSDP
ncbi:MAG TPA: glycosyltransferase [Vicinamibacterales bacterium]|nr:glycosyltransferase [Vicinamibacterales bacterium]